MLQLTAYIPFCRLGVLYDMPGMFYIGKLLRNTPHREAFTVNPNGFWFRREVRHWSQLLVSGPSMYHSAAPNAVLPPTTSSNGVGVLKMNESTLCLVLRRAALGHMRWTPEVP